MEQPSTMSAALWATAVRWPDQGFFIEDGDGREAFLAYADLPVEVRGVAAALQGHGVRAGDRVGLIESDVRRFIVLFLALMECGAVAVPMAPPTSVTARAPYLAHVQAILRQSGAEVLLLGESSLRGAEAELTGMATGRRVLSTVSLKGDANAFSPARVAPDDLAFLQFTSGSTGTPKGVRVPHRALVANIQAFMRRLEADPEEDCGVSWLPLYHDMGLIGFVLAPLYCGVSCVLLPTTRFIRKPTAWLDAIHHHRGTITFAPNFALSLLLRRVRREHVPRWDLSSLKAFGCGAEPIHTETLRRFVDHFASAGLRESVLVPAYGLAESCLAVTMKPLGAPLVTRERKDRRAQTRQDVACGVPLEGHRVEIRDADGMPVPAGSEGEIWTTGPSLTDGYYENPGSTDKAFVGGWLRTGDLGYLEEGQLFVTGRIKDLIIIHGRNHHPQGFEWAAAEVEGVRRGSVVAFARPGTESEELVILAEVTRSAPELKRTIAIRVQEQCGVTPTVVELLPAGRLPKTSSGKLRRREARDAYIHGILT